MRKNPQNDIEIYENVNIVNIIDEKKKFIYGNECFFICNITEVIKKIVLWKSTFPRIKPYYAVKCNNYDNIIKVLASSGIGFDCATKSEIDLILDHGVEPERIIFAHTIKPAAYIKHASDVSVNLMTFDNEEELKKMKKVNPNVKVILRIKCISTEELMVYAKKFGCDVNTEASTLLSLARSLDVEVLGVSFHVGSGCKDPNVFYVGIQSARCVFDIAKQYGYNMSLLNIGGGYDGTNKKDFVEKFASTINNAIDEYFSDLSITIMAEPGAFFVDTAFTLACNITGKKRNLDKMIYYINDSIHSCFSARYVYDIPVTVYPLKRYPNEPLYTSVIFGGTCSGSDKLTDSLLLPDMQVDEWLIFENMGAYTLSLATTFNGFPIPKVISVIDNYGRCFLKDFLLDIHFFKHTYVDKKTDENSELNMDKEHLSIFLID
ncbi:hypothetical protein FQA39_LY09446 [Lamprigera yunnana]|nr:hypothetical protein FQA39_LY09446 [Lamprigera yunnana]